MALKAQNDPWANFWGGMLSPFQNKSGTKYSPDLPQTFPVIGGPYGGSQGSPNFRVPGYYFGGGQDQQPLGYYFSGEGRKFPRGEAPSQANLPEAYPLTPQFSSMLDDTYEQLWLATNQEIEKQQQENIRTRRSAIGMLMGAERGVREFYEPLLEETRGIPLNPFSDELRADLLANINDEITRNYTSARQVATEQLSRLGATGLDTAAQVAAGGLQSEALRQRVNAITSTAEEQLAFNTRANLERQNLLRDIGGQEQSLLTQLGAGRASIEAGNVLDPLTYANTLGQTYGLQLSKEQQEQIMNMIASMQPSQQELLMQAFPTLVAGLAPSMDRVFTLSTLPYQMMSGTQFTNPFALSGNKNAA